MATSTTTSDPGASPSLFVISADPSEAAHLDLPPDSPLNVQHYLIVDKATFWRDLTDPSHPLHSASVLVRNPISNPQAVSFGWTHELVALSGAPFPPNLELVVMLGHGLDAEDVAGCAARGVTVRGTDGGSESTAVAAVWLALSVFRGFGRGERHARAVSKAAVSASASASNSNGAEQPTATNAMMAFFKVTLEATGAMGGSDSQGGLDLAGRKAGIIGYGNIGRRIGQLLQAFGMNVACFSRRGSAGVPEGQASFRGDDGVEVFAEMDEMLRVTDLVVLACPSTPETVHLINRQRIAGLKRGVRIVNVARGKCIDEEALVWGLEEGIVAGAGLDVFEFEPKIHPKLLDMENVAITPHMGGSTREAYPKHYRSAGRIAHELFASRR